jgi:hypothetical protein
MSKEPKKMTINKFSVAFSINIYLYKTQSEHIPISVEDFRVHSIGSLS